MNTADPIFPAPLSAIILAGGASQRMQRDKTMLRIGGSCLIESLVRQLQKVFSEIIISASNPGKYSYLELPIAVDEQPGQGPLMAILSSLRISKHAVNFVIACDIPEIHLPFLKKMITLAHENDIVVPHYRDGKFEPLFALYQRRIIPLIEKQLREGMRKISPLFGSCRTEFVSMDEQHWFRNLNTPKEYHDYLKQKIATSP